MAFGKNCCCCCCYLTVVLKKKSFLVGFERESRGKTEPRLLPLCPQGESGSVQGAQTGVPEQRTCWC